MAYKYLNHWVASLTALLTDVATVLPISAADATRLGTLLGADTTTLLLRDGVYYEVVRVTVSGSVATIERGLEGTTARAFANGSCVAAFLSEAGLEEVICAADCSCTEIIMRAGAQFAQPTVGVPWEHTWFFAGTKPFTVTEVSVPDWATVDDSELADGLLTVTGTPDDADTQALTLAVNGCAESVVMIEEDIIPCAPTGVESEV